MFTFADNAAEWWCVRIWNYICLCGNMSVVSTHNDNVNKTHWREWKSTFSCMTSKKKYFSSKPFNSCEILITCYIYHLYYKAVRATYCKGNLWYWTLVTLRICVSLDFRCIMIYKITNFQAHDLPCTSATNCCIPDYLKFRCTYNLPWLWLSLYLH